MLSDESESLWIISVDNVEYTIANSTPVTPNTSQKLVDIITPGDYGKSIDYSVTVNGTTLNDWKVFLNDGNNVYIILGDCIPSGLGIPIESSSYINHFSRDGVEFYGAAYESGGYLFLEDTQNFTDFVDSNFAISATGGPTKEQLETSSGVTDLSDRRYFRRIFICKFT